MASLLVLGSTGKLGQLLRSHWPVGGPLEIVWHGRRTKTELQFDILTEPRVLAAAIDEADAVLLLAGTTSPPFGSNVDITRAVCAASNSKPILFVSSAAVYGRGVCTENADLEPVSDYGRAKRDAESVARAYDGRRCVLRIGNVIGADALLGGDRTARSLHIFEDGRSPLRSYINPQLLAELLEALAIRMTAGEVLPDSLNIACPEPVFMADLLTTAGLNWTKVPAPPEAIPSVVLDTSRIETLFEFPKDASTPANLLKDWRI